MHTLVASTQDAAIAAARAGDPGRLAILAERQHAGRGSRGRDWASPPGNLALSVLLRPNAAVVDPARWALLAGVALHDALAPYAPGLMLKWPNDLIFASGKLGGILIDSETEPDGGLAWVVIGLGANLTRAPEIADRLAVCLPDPPPDARAVARAVVDNLDAYSAQSTAAICSAWLARAHPIGTQMDVLTATRRIQGRFAGLTECGELRLEGNPGAISSAEVFLPIAGEPIRNQPSLLVCP